MSNSKVSVLNNETSNDFASMPTTTNNNATALTDKVSKQDAEIAKLKMDSIKAAGKVLVANQNALLGDNGAIDLQKVAKAMRGMSLNATITTTIGNDEKWANAGDQSVKIVFVRVPKGAFASLQDNFQYKVEGSEKVFSMGLNATSTKLSILLAAKKLSMDTPIAANFVKATGQIKAHIRITDEKLEKAFSELVGSEAATTQNTPEIANSLTLGGK